MRLKTLLALLFLLDYFGNTVWAQDDKTVSIVASGNGKSLDDAKQAALRNAIEQAFGTFISAKTDILDDKLVSDQITSVSSGNIQKYEPLNEAQLPDGSWATTLKAIVSVSKLTSFVQAKGVSVEIKGGLFALNIKQQMLNEQGEIRAIQDMIFLLHEPMLQAFDYAITSGDPKSVDAENKNWSIPLSVTAKANKNFGFVINYLSKTLGAISLTTSEAINYQSLGKDVFPIALNGKKYYLRKRISLYYLTNFYARQPYYTKNFFVDSGKSTELGHYANSTDTYTCSSNVGYWSSLQKDATFTSCNIGDVAGTFVWNDKRSLQEIEQLTGFSVKPAFPMPINAESIQLGDYFAGGTVFYLDSSGKHGLVVSPIDVGMGSDWGCEGFTPNTSEAFGAGAANTKSIASECEEASNAAKICIELVANGYNDWFLPSKDELKMMAENLDWKDFGSGIYNSTSTFKYWSSSHFYQFEAYYLEAKFYRGTKPRLANQSKNSRTYKDTAIRPIRAF